MCPFVKHFPGYGKLPRKILKKFFNDVFLHLRWLTAVLMDYNSTNSHSFESIGHLMAMLLNYQIVQELLLGKVSNRHILKTRPPNYKLSAHVLPVEAAAKGSKHGHI